jgi:hypothetical protein
MLILIMTISYMYILLTLSILTTDPLQLLFSILCLIHLMMA